jgi:hypothetical protein
MLQILNYSVSNIGGAKFDRWNHISEKNRIEYNSYNNTNYRYPCDYRCYHLSIPNNFGGDTDAVYDCKNNNDSICNTWNKFYTNK